MIITYRNPQNLKETIDVYFDVIQNDFTKKWKSQLKQLLQQDYHLEKNYCFLGFADSPRNVDFICKKINESIEQINNFNSTGKWQQQGLADYTIQDHFDKDKVMYSENLPIGTTDDGEEMTKPGLRLKHDAMNRLHRYFEDLQGEAWGLSNYYKIADFKTKYAIRQLNDLCHELESFVISYRKSKVEPEWQRPSQINTWLQAPRTNLEDNDYELFLQNKFDRECGGVYLHWAQIGKTHIEVFRDEDGKDIDDVVCSSISALKYYTGEFDIEWGKTITEQTYPWFAKEQKAFLEWLERNGFDQQDPKLALGFIKLAQCNLKKSFNTEDPLQIWSILSTYLDVYKIQIDDVSNTFDYSWSQSDFEQKQIEIMKPGYIWSSRS